MKNALKKHILMALCTLLVSALQAQTIYVDVNATGTNKGTSWVNAFTDLQDALDSNMAGTVDTILIAEGTYYPTQSHNGDTTDARDRVFHLANNNVKIIGGYNASAGTQTGGNTILSGDIGTLGDSSDNCYHVFISKGLNASTIIDHILITDGRANGDGAINYANGSFVRYQGGGMYNISSSPNITNAVFTNNNADFGGGMFSNISSSPKLTNCTFSNNNADNGGAIRINSASNNITNCFFINNKADNGGGIYANNASSNITNCSFTNNSASIIGGGLVNVSSTISFTNCSFTNNRSNSYGGAMFNFFNSTLNIRNCSFTGNSASTRGGGMYNQVNCIILITNTVFFNNTAFLNKAVFNDVISFLHSNSTNNAIDADSSLFPNIKTDLSNTYYKDLFVDSTDLDGPDNIWGTEDDGLRPIACSVLEGAGTTVGAPLEDIIGLSRVSPPTIGAYRVSSEVHIIDHPQKTSLCENHSDSFIVTISCNYDSIQWQKYTTSWERIENSNNLKLIISNVQLADNGSQYRCIAFNPIKNDTSGVATLTVNANSAIGSVSAFKNIICQGNEDTITANVTLGTGATLTWFTGPGGTGSNLGTDNPLHHTPTGNISYYVRLTGTCNTVEDSTTVAMKSLPVISSITSSRNPTVNGYAPYQCTDLTATATGAGILTYDWNTSDTGTIINVCPTAGTTYQVLVTDGNGCVQVDSFKQWVQEATSNYPGRLVMCYTYPRRAPMNINIYPSQVPQYLNAGATLGACGSSPSKRAVESTYDAIYSVYPNPAQNQITVEWFNLFNETVNIEMVDMTGRVVKNIYNGEVLEGIVSSITADVSNLRSGMYFMRYSSPTDIRIIKVQLMR